MDLPTAARHLEAFVSGRLTERVADIERSLIGAGSQHVPAKLAEHAATPQSLAAAMRMKSAAAQIDVVIHALGIVLLAPRLLDPGESILSLSLGAGNTGREFDLETTHRVAEFKFIRWQGGSESIRQNALFKDFYLLAEHETPKRRFVYVLNTHHPLRFLNGGRSISSVLSRHVALSEEFSAKYGARFGRVRDYYAFRRDLVAVVDVEPQFDAILREAGVAG